ncbi:MAG: hypothetical protein EXR67_07030 [Dehalococcoidia bacterium]|nr:hypothetical protein [Dehalococcoidia bacterium]
MLPPKTPVLLLLVVLLAFFIACEPQSSVPPASTPIATSGAAPVAAAAPVVITTSPDSDLYRLAESLRHVGTASALPRTAEPRVGQSDQFWVTDLNDKRVRRITASLVLVMPNAYWYVQDGENVDQNAIQESARFFEEQVVSKEVAMFGSPAHSSALDGRITILHAALQGVAGYFSGMDSYPQAVHHYSNERRMLYMNIKGMRLGTSQYKATLAHEFQHALHFDADPTEDTWINEGLSEFAAETMGFPSGFMRFYVEQPSLSLTEWPLEPNDSPPYYGLAHLFVRYLLTHYGSAERARDLLAQQADSIDGVSGYLRTLGVPQTFADVFKDWTVANLLAQQGNDRYSYANPPPRISLRKTLGQGKFVNGQVPQFGSEFIKLDGSGSATLRFQGVPLASLLPTKPFSGNACWWGNRGDGIDSRMTRAVDLTGQTSASLGFRIWYSTEEQWDYAYVVVSGDSGKTWDVLPSTHTSPENPVGNSYGPGFTGASKGWLQERVDLTPYAGQKLLLRFQYITDESINGDGLCIDDISVPEVGFFDDAESDAGGWQAEGFQRLSLTLPQLYAVQVVQTMQNGQITVLQVPLDQTSAGKLRLDGLDSQVQSAVVIVSGMTEHTRVPTTYKVSLDAQ